MRVDVLNGVNLDQLGRRDPEIYGTLTLRELESRLYAWGKQLGLPVRCRQTNDEGAYVDWLHEALDVADGVVLNPAAWTHYSWAIHDAVELLKQPVVEVHLSNVDEREEWRRLSVISDLLQQAVEVPLLVSSLVNVRYLTGLASSNAALLVEPERVRLFTDFRYAERAREVPDVELVVTRRDI